MVNKLKHILIFSLAAYILGSLFIRIFPDLLINEMAISFLPYILFFNIFVTVVLFVIYIFEVFKLKPALFKKFLRRNKILLFLSLFIFLDNIFLFLPIRSFAFADNLTETNSNKNQNIKIVFYNKFAFNENYEEIENKIKEIDADIIGFSEFNEAPKNYEFLKSYQYSYTPNCECFYKGDGVALYSKFPITDTNFYFLDISPTLSAKVNINSEVFDIFVVHTSAPVSSKNLEFRNKQLDFVSAKVKENNNKNTIILGDLNLSPWSNDYKNFDKSLESLKNSARGKGLKFTWRFEGPKSISVPLPPFYSHIDHIFVPEDFIVKNFIVEKNFGSDHNMVLTEIER